MACGLDDFKAAFRRLASGVCVVTFFRGEHLHGFTATSVTSISADPPMLLFCVSSGSDSFDTMEVGLEVGVSVLSSEQQDLAERFALKVAPGGYDDVALTIVGGGTPALRDAISAMSSRVVRLAPAGDDVVVFCEVEAARASAAGDPLVYGDGRYVQR